MSVHQSIDTFLKQLIWRDFAYHQLIHYPDIIRLPLRKQFVEFPWQGTNEQLHEMETGADRLSVGRCRHAGTMGDRHDA